ncbi:MAG: DsbA family protein [Thermodesulfobacteriota bacterium]
MKITIYYDYVCPFCYLGTKRILELSREFSLELEWKGTEIHPEFPPEGKSRSKTIKSKSFAKTVYTMAEQDNIAIKLPGFATNSRKALEASEFAKTQGKFLDFHNAIYEAYFVNRKNIGDLEVVIDIGKKADVDAEELREALTKRTMFDKIENNKKDAEDNLILGVPTFVIGKLPVYGNQSMDTMRDIIRRSLKVSSN